MKPAHAQKLGAVILAAGRSARMGRPKLLLPWGKTTVLGHLVEEWQRLGAGQITVVCAAGDAAIHAELDRLGFPLKERIINPRPDRGMFSSIQCAARWKGWRRALRHWAIVLGDQPHLRPETLAAVVQAGAKLSGHVSQPAWHGQAGHPVLLPKELFLLLAHSRAKTLKGFLQRKRVILCEVDDPGLTTDLDTPEDYEAAVRGRWFKKL